MTVTVAAQTMAGVGRPAGGTVAAAAVAVEGDPRATAQTVRAATPFTPPPSRPHFVF